MDSYRWALCHFGLHLTAVSQNARSLVLVLSLPTAAFCGLMLKEACALGEVFGWVVDWARPVYTARNVLSCIVRDISTLPGAILALMVVIAGVGSLQLLAPGTSGQLYSGLVREEIARQSRCLLYKILAF